MVVGELGGCSHTTYRGFPPFLDTDAIRSPSNTLVPTMASIFTIMTMLSSRILVVDDDDHVRKLISEFLTSAGYDIDVARDGEEALGRVRRTRYDAALLDCEMPVMNGVTLHRRIRELDAVLAGRCVLMSGGDHPISAKLPFLNKPFTQPTLLAVLRRILGKSDSPRAESQ